MTVIRLIRRRGALGATLLVIAAAFVVIQARPATALVFTPTRFDDPTPDGCAPGGADRSLRETILSANTNPGSDTIMVPAGPYTLTRGGEDDTASLGDLDIVDTGGVLTITGAGAGTTTINGDGATTDDPVFHLQPSTSASISGLTITGGQNPFDGGGISASGAVLTVTDSVLTNNSSGAAGGGIGASSSTISLTNVTLTNNQAAAGGGLLSTGASSLVNSTVSGNRATESGGGLLIAGSGSLTLNNVTVTNNTADSNNIQEFAPESGGGINTTFGSPTVTLKNSVVAGNTVGATGANPDCSGPVTSGGYNVVQNPTGCTGLGASGDLTGVDPLLGPLSSGGGPTPTHALIPGSPAIDHGSPSAPGSGGDACAPTDQRGIARPQLTDCDSGAVEVQASELPTCFGKPPTAVGSSLKDSLKATAKADVILAFGDNDVVNGSGGNDRVCGGEGNDKLKGAGGKDKLKGDQGKDTCIGGPSRDKAVKCEKLKTVP